MEEQQQQKKRPLINVRTRREEFEVLARYCKDTGHSLPEAVDEALRDYIKKHGMEAKA